MTVEAIVGREREIEVLIAALDAAAAGTGGLVFVVGEAGIGKTTLLAETARIAGERRFSSVVSRCHHDQRETPPYWPWIQILRRLRRAGALGADHRRLFQTLDLDPDGQRSEPPVQTRFAVSEEVVLALADGAARRPLLIGIDDLDAADRSSQHLVAHLGDAVGDLPVLFVATCRTPRPNTAFEKFVVGTLRHASASELVVSGLAAEDVADFMQRALGCTPDRADDVWRMTAGNPLYVGELVRALRDAGPGGLDRVPIRLTSALRAPLSALDARASRALEALAVVGDHAPRWLLVEMVGDLDDAIESAIAATVVEVDADSVVRFRHPLLREAVYADLDPVARTAWHQRAASVLAARAAPDLDALAIHRCAAVTPETASAAVAVAQQAAARAARMHAYDEAAAHLARARAALQADPHRTRAVEIDLLVDNADAYRRAGSFDEALDCYRQAFDRADAADLANMRAVAAIRFEDVICESGQTRWGADDRSIHQLERVADVDSPVIDDVLTSRVKAALARAYFFVHKEPEAVSLAEDAVRVARAAHDAEAIAFALECRRTVTWSKLTPDERAALCGEIDAWATEADSPDLALQARHFALYGPLAAGDLVEVDRVIAEFDGLATRLGRPQWLCYTDLFRAMRSIQRADVDDALAYIAHAESHGRHVGSLNVTQFCTAQRFSVARMTGEWGDLSDRFSSFVGATGSGPTWRCMDAQLTAEMGAVDLAHAALESAARGGYRMVEDDVHRLFSLCCLAEAAIALGDRDRAEELLALLLPHATVVVPNIAGLHGTVGHACGGLALTCGDLAAARSLLEDALARHLAIGATSWVAFTRLRLARTMLTSAAPDDARRLRELCDAVSAFVSTNDVWRLESQLDELRAACVFDEAHPLAELSERELEVAALLAESRSNIEISNDLYISVKTVKSHVSHVLAKLGLRSRTEVALLVQRVGLPTPPRISPTIHPKTDAHVTSVRPS